MNFSKTLKICILLPESKTVFVKSHSIFNTAILVLFVLTAGNINTSGQQIEYSVPLGDNIQNTDFDIVGYCHNHLLIFKSSYNEYNMVLYNDSMNIIDQVPLKFLPKETVKEDFVNLGNKVIMIYQYTHKKDIYCESVQLNEDAVPLSKPVLIDKTIHPEQVFGDKAYAAIHSDDKSKIMIFEMMGKEDSLEYHIHTFLYDSTMRILNTGSVNLSYAVLDEKPVRLKVADDGDLYFLMGNKTNPSDPYYQRMKIYFKPAGRDTLLSDTVSSGGHLLKSNPVLKIDELHQKLWVSAFGYDNKIHNIDRLMLWTFSMDSLKLLKYNTVLLTDSIKKNMESKDEGLHETFNDYNLNQLVVGNDESTLLIAEEKYTDINNVTHHNDMAFFTINSSGGLTGIQKIKKDQGSDLSSVYASYMMVNIGHALHFLMNKSHHVFRFLNNYRYLLTDYRYGDNQKLEQMPTLRGLANKYFWAPRYGVQVSRSEVVVPCTIGSSLLFAKIAY